MADEGRIDSRRPAIGGLGAIHVFFGAFPLAYFILAFITDWAYADSTNLQWQYFSIWLITAGLVTGAISILIGIVEWLMTRRTTARRDGGWHGLISLIAWILALVNAFVHSRDGWTAVVPTGIILSAVVALLMLVAAVLSALSWGRTLR